MQQVAQQIIAPPAEIGAMLHQFVGLAQQLSRFRREQGPAFGRFGRVRGESEVVVAFALRENPVTLLFHNTQTTPMRPPAEVLIVEDEPAIMILLAAICRRNHFAVAEAHDGAQALARIGRREFDIILLDLLLPEVNGFEVLRHIDAVQPELMQRIIIVTACSEPTYRDCSQVRSVWSLVRKPFDVDELEREMLACREETMRRARRSMDVPQKYAGAGSDALPAPALGKRRRS